VASVRSYAMALLRWLRFLHAVGVAWDRADLAEARDFVLWMRIARPARPRRNGVPAPSGVNARTGKRILGTTYAPATINHNLAVVSEFYRFHMDMGGGPLRNPVPSRGRVSAGMSPLEPFRHRRRSGLRQRVPDHEPRAIPDGLFDELFAALPSDRDRAIVALYVSTGARPSELLGVRCADIDYGDQLVAVIRKGTRALQWLPASPDSFVWLRLYQHSLPSELLAGDQPVWWTLRRPWRALDYDAMRAVLRRVNAMLETNWTLHDLRHTFAVRMAADPKMPLVSLQVLLGHAHLSTTEWYLRPHLEQVIAHARDHQARQRIPDAAREPGPVLGYETDDLQVLFGWREPGGDR
jgi:integrase